MPERSRRHSRNGSGGGAGRYKEFGIDWNFTRTAGDEPLYAIEPVAQGASTPSSPRRRGADEVLVNNELQNKSAQTRPSVRPAYRGRTARA